MLICPACQSTVDWTAELDQCPVCSSVHLVRRLGEVECRDCGDVREPSPVAASVSPISGVPPSASGASGASAASAGGDGDFAEAPGLAEEVELALARVLGRAGKPARIG